MQSSHTSCLSWRVHMLTNAAGCRCRKGLMRSFSIECHMVILVPVCWLLVFCEGCSLVSSDGFGISAFVVIVETLLAPCAFHDHRDSW
jgi:hypothetical protein